VCRLGFADRKPKGRPPVPEDFDPILEARQTDGHPAGRAAKELPPEEEAKAGRLSTAIELLATSSIHGANVGPRSDGCRISDCRLAKDAAQTIRLDGVPQSESFFPQTVIAVIWDFDRTLIPGYMQEPLFARYDVKDKEFWNEVQALERHYRDHGAERVSADTIYMGHILTYVREGIFPNLNNSILRELGKELKLYPGMPALMKRLKNRVTSDPNLTKYDITLEHYIVSTGLRQTILGSAVAKQVEDVFACEFLEVTARPGFLTKPGAPLPPVEHGVIFDVGYAIDNTTKTRAVFEINKGVNKYPEYISVNDRMDSDRRRVPIDHMIYVADGPSDVPVFSIVRQYGGKTLGVYNRASPREFAQVLDLQENGRIDAFGPADYRPGTHVTLCLEEWVDQIAKRIAERRERLLGEHVQKSPQHIVEEGTEAPQDEIGRL
jgi:hypothetical protein